VVPPNLVLFWALCSGSKEVWMFFYDIVPSCYPHAYGGVQKRIFSDFNCVFYRTLLRFSPELDVYIQLTYGHNMRLLHKYGRR